MTRTSLVFLMLFAIGLGLMTVRARSQSQAAAPAAQAAPAIPARPADVASPDAILAATYDVISGPAGQKRDWDRFRSLFAPGARLIPTGPTPDGSIAVRTLSADDYVSRASARFESAGFYEKEIARHTEQWGHILQAFSTYESRHDAKDATPFARGINSFQLFFDGKRWWIVTIFWEAETPQTQLTKDFLPAGN
jgi:hypothetical protein